MYSKPEKIINITQYYLQTLDSNGHISAYTFAHVQLLIYTAEEQNWL